MITWLVGENDFEIREALKDIEANFSGSVERVDASELLLAQLPDLLMGTSLFSQSRLVVLKDITLNKSLWEKLPNWLPRISDDIHVVFVDSKPDKRTVGFKALKSVASVQEFPTWSDRDTAKAQHWVAQRAKKLGFSIDGASAKALVDKSGVNQWSLAKSLEILSLYEPITPELVETHISAQPSESVFELLEAALNKKSQRVAHLVGQLSLQEDPFGLSALIYSQAMSLAALAFADSSTDNPIKDFSIHPFVASKLTKHSKALGKNRVGQVIEILAQLDANIKRSKAEPWLLIEQALLKIAQ